MIVRINTGAKPAGAVLYNEHKVAHGEARFLGFVNVDVFDEKTLRITDKIMVLDAFTKLNERISKPTFHASLAFHPSEQLSDERIKLIGQQYMDRLGYGDQPYLMYRHEDTNHPHIHIVSVSIDHDGKRISDSHLQRRSNAIRQKLEQENGLMEAEKQGKQVLMDGLLPEQILTYQEPEAKKAIGNVVRTAMNDYHFSNLMSFSEFLHQHKIQLNVHEGQTTGGTPYRGLSFQLHDGDIDQRGQAIGPAIKASSFGFAPTLDRLEAKFKRGAYQVATGQMATVGRINASLREFSKVSEADYKSQLRAQGVQVIDTGQQYVYIDHKSRNVYAETELGALFSRQHQRSLFAPNSERRAMTKPGINPLPTPALQSKPHLRINLLPPTQDKPAPTTNPQREQALQRWVAHYYQRVRTQGQEGKPALFFESQLIAQFPYQHLTQALIGEGVAKVEAQRAVSQFETYKQGQLTDIRAKEVSYFTQTATLLGRLAGQMPIAAESKQAFLQSMGLELTALGLIHQQDKFLRLPLRLDQLMELRADRGPKLAFRQKATKHERSLYLAIADKQPAPANVSFYQVSAVQLRSSIGAQRFDEVAPSLNTNYLNQVVGHQEQNRPLWFQLAQRGLLLERGMSTTVRVGHHLTNPDQFVSLPKELTERLATERLPPVESQRVAQQSGIGRNLVLLTQALDMGETRRVELMVSAYARELAKLPSSTTKPPTAESMRAQLQERFAGLHEPLLNAHPSTRKAPVSTPVVNTSQYGEQVVALLLNASITTQERGYLVQQMGLNWQTTSAGDLRLIEDSTGLQPGAVYWLSSSQQPFFTKPDDGSNPSLSMREADRQLVRTYLSEKPLSASGLAGEQIARLNLPVLKKLLPESAQGALQQWYHQPRGAQIIVNTAAQAKEASARRYLSNLYQRGFLVQQVAGAAGQPGHYRMGHFQAHPHTYVPVPALLIIKLNQTFPERARGTGFIVEAAWPELHSAQTTHMMRLAAAVDGNQKTPVIQEQMNRLQQLYPGLRPLSQPQDMLDLMVSGSAGRNPTVSTPSAPFKPTSKAIESTGQRDPETDSLLNLLERGSTQNNQKGFLDILGDSTEVVRPKKKRIGQDDRHRPKFRR